MYETKTFYSYFLLGGFINCDVCQARYPKIFRYAEKEGGPVFWISMYGEDICRYHFFGDYLGIDAKPLNRDDYLRIVQSKEYEEMPLWPAEGSVAMIDGYAVIKIWENPPLY